MSWAPSRAVYALAEGLVLGGLSAMIESRYPGIAMQAVAMTFGTLACMLLAYRAGLIRATNASNWAWSPPRGQSSWCT